MNNKGLKVLPVLDGGNPQNSTDIICCENGYLIKPIIEDGNPNYMFHLNVLLENTIDKPLQGRFIIEWGTELYQNDRIHLMLYRDKDCWEYFDEVKIDGSRTIAVGMVPPGISYLCLHPRYEYKRLLTLADSLPEDVFTIRVIGKTRMNRDILAFESGNPSKIPIAFYCRGHPYETIGSYLIEGMFKWLMKKGNEAEKFLIDNYCVFVPMPNTDGVADGRNRITHGGLNFSANFRNSAEPEAVALKAYFAHKKPSVIFDIHAWNNPWENIVTNDGKMGKALYKVILANEELFFRPVEIRYQPIAWNIADHSCNYFADELGVSFFNSSWNPHGRTAADFYSMGTILLKAAAKAANAGSQMLNAPFNNRKGTE